MRSANKYLACLAITISILISGSAAYASFTDPVGTTTQVTAAVKSSITTKRVSAAVAATLKQFSNSSSYDLTGPSTYGACDPYDSEALALSPKPCFFGNLHGSKTIALVGDSNVGNWVPALSIGLAATQYRLAAVTCLTVHPDPQDCSLTYAPGSGYYGAALTRDKLIASLSKATLINTNKFLCYKDACSPVIGNILVYSDIDHITIAYSSFISKGITSAVLAALK